MMQSCHNGPQRNLALMVRSTCQGNCRGFLLLRFLLLHMACIATAKQQMGPPRSPIIAGLSENASSQAQYAPLFGEPGDIDSSLDDGNMIRLRLDTQSGSGIRSQDTFFRGFFNAAIKLPGGYSAGVVSAFYASNADYYPYTHDEFDIEFLGVRRGQPYVMQTNVYGDGSTDIGREERFHLWFDPTADFHNYSILWTYHHIVFFVDNIPVRRYVNSDALGLQYPSKPMNAYATIWDGSNWATEGGLYPVDYTQAPFDVIFTNFQLEGCVWNPAVEPTPPSCTMANYRAWFNDNAVQEMSDEQLIALDWARTNFMWYSYCDDRQRYSVLPPECPDRGHPNSTITGDKRTSDRDGRLHRPELKSIARRSPRPTQGIATSRSILKRHKDKNGRDSTESKAFRYLPHSLWKSKVPVRIEKGHI